MIIVGIMFFIIAAACLFKFIGNKDGGDSSSSISSVEVITAAPESSSADAESSSSAASSLIDNTDSDPGKKDTPTPEPTATPGPTLTAKATETPTPEPTKAVTVNYKFRSKKLLNDHYEKHGKDMGFASAEEYQAAAAAVVTDPKALHKTEKEDGDDIYYIEATNDFVVVSTDGYLRTYFWPDAGKKYFDRQ